ncbi:MAG: hypothetical protein WAO55_05190 [Candidatus Manganitrophaceae bacterium]
MREKIRQIIESKEAPLPDPCFEEAARDLFRYQFDQNPPYRQFCLSRNRNPETVRSWQEIPPLPATAFKIAEISCQPIRQAARIFRSSGTTGGTPGETLRKNGWPPHFLGQRSQHALFDLELARAAILGYFQRHLLPEGKPIRMAILTPSPEEAPDSSLAHMMGVVRDAYGTDESRYYIENGRLLFEPLITALSTLREPVALLGTSFSFVHLLDFLRERSLRLPLSAGSRLMDTGGFKGRSREIPREQLYSLYRENFGLSPEYCINEYGMSEMTSQFYDGIAGRSGRRVYVAPPQVRTRFLHPETLEPVSKGEVGLLAHYDLANIDSALAILTEDLGREVEGGFVLLGRAPGAEAKGCSITLDDLLQTDREAKER